jgi:hypothetical protein
MNEISTRIFVAYLMDKSRVFLTREEAEIIKTAMRQEKKYVEIGESMIAVSQIVKVVTGPEHQEGERLRQGDYQCSRCQHWIPKGKQCGWCK